MTKILFILALLPFTASAASFQTVEEKEVRISGVAARELYDSLALPEQRVYEEHTGMPYAKAKYGKNFGCERGIDTDSTYCWFHGQQQY
ncbi:MAG: hypothetical protein AB7K68_13895 [Bacteriovoracia bacterium]